MEYKEDLINAPLIDLKKIGSLSLSEIPRDLASDLAKELVENLKICGFIGLKNHGLPLIFVKQLNESCERFFSLPQDYKLNFKRDIKTLHGYTDGSYEKLDIKEKVFELKETFDITNLNLSFPDRVPEVKQSAKETVDVLAKFVEKLLFLLEKGLGLEKGSLNDMHMNLFSGFSTLRILYYPTVQDDVSVNTIRCGEHLDISTFTLQFQDKIGGFQIENNGVWKNADGDPDIISLFCGMTIERLTGGLLKSVNHRVIVPKNDEAWKSPRKCVALFVHPDPKRILKNFSDSSDNGITNEEFVNDYMEKIYASDKK